MISSSSVDPTLLRSFFFIVTLVVLHFFIVGGHALHRRSSGDQSPTVSSHFPEECDPISMGTRSEMLNCISQPGAASKQMFPATKRDLQRELEQVESGLRPARREFSTSTHSGRPRERYRERENGRSSTEGNLRTSGSLQTETGTSNSSLTTMPSVVLAGSRPFSGQVPTILQSRDRLDDGGSSYEENFDGSKDSGDTGSIGDADLVSALEGQPGGVGSAQRHGSRGSKSSRQMIERRERDGRREGKWERKHY